MNNVIALKKYNIAKYNGLWIFAQAGVQAEKNRLTRLLRSDASQESISS